MSDTPGAGASVDAFLDALGPGEDFGFRTFDDQRGRSDTKLIARRYGRLADVRDELGRLNDRGAGVFFSVNRLDGKGHTAQNVVDVRALFLDLDDDGPTGLAAVRAWEGFPPHAVVETSPDRFHVYWFLAPGSIDLDAFPEAQRSLIRRFGGDPSVHDLPRVLRLPGFHNHKRTPPFLGRVLELRPDMPRYSSDLVAGLVAGPGGRRRQEKRKAAKANAQAGDTGPTALPEVLPEGEREHHLVSYAGTLRRKGADEDEILAALKAMSAKRCRPPVPEQDLQRIARSIAKKPVGNDIGGFVRGDNGSPKKDHQGNVRLALLRMGVHVAYDEFADRALVIREGQEPEHLEDHVVDRLWLEMDETFGFRPSRTFFDTVVSDTARQESFHPVRDYLADLEWDGKPRLDTWLVDYAGAPDTDYVRAVSRIVLVAAVRRVRRPGAKFDEMLVLESPQGTEKSSALAALCPDPDWFTDDLPLNVSSKEVIERTRGKWIVEAAEMSGLRRGDVEHLNAFLSRRVDVARMAYARHTTERPRHFVAIGTTNDRHYLKDATGNRRFWPCRVKRFDVAGLRSVRDQLWAEAADRDAAGASIRLDSSLWDAAGKVQEERFELDPWEELMGDLLGDLVGWFDSQAAFDTLNVDPSRRNQVDGARLARVLARLGFEKKRLRRAGRLRYVYTRGPDEEARGEIEFHREDGSWSARLSGADSEPF